MKLIALLSILLLSQNASAWGDRGHEMVGHLAQEQLTPRAKRAIETILGRDFKLANEATWPDKMRSNRTFDRFKPWHYADHPATTLADVLGKNFPKPEDLKENEKAALPFVGGLLDDHPYLLVNHAPKGDALAALNLLENLIRSPRAKKEQKIFAIRYIAHIVGDIHMPLHIGSGLDAGGNSCLVKWQGREKKIFQTENGPVEYDMNIHIVWDDEIPDTRVCGKGPCDSLEYAQLLSREYQKEIAQNKHKWVRGSHLDWAKESADFRESVYPVVKDASGLPVQAEGKPAGRPYCKTSATDVIDSKLKPDLADAYYTQWKKIAETRILQAGHRLGAMLNVIFR
ncbi:MAG TPA: S1/P1 nuclease [Bdellovibrionales bacterium]|nr:S1/P1 nuclease [Bdellovibrionales bacterium]